MKLLSSLASLAVSLALVSVQGAKVGVDAAGNPYDLESKEADHYEAAVGWAEEGDMAAAIKSFRAHTKHNAKDGSGWRNLGLALQDEDFADRDSEDAKTESIAALKQCLSMDIGDMEAREALNLLEGDICADHANLVHKVTQSEHDRGRLSAATMAAAKNVFEKCGVVVLKNAYVITAPCGDNFVKN
jgi:hypothetical protein